MKNKNQVDRKQKVKGIIFIGIGILGLIIYTAVSFRDIQLGGGFFIVLISVGFILEGWRAIKGKKSLFFGF